MLDVSVEEGRGVAKVNYETSDLIISGLAQGLFPEFELAKEDVLDKIREFQGSVDIDFEEYPDFSEEYFLQGANESEIRAFFNEPLVRFFEKNKGYKLISRNNSLLIHKQLQLLDRAELEALLDVGEGFLRLVGQKA